MAKICHAGRGFQGQQRIWYYCAFPFPALPPFRIVKFSCPGSPYDGQPLSTLIVIFVKIASMEQTRQMPYPSQLEIPRLNESALKGERQFTPFLAMNWFANFRQFCIFFTRFRKMKSKLRNSKNTFLCLHCLLYTISTCTRGNLVRTPLDMNCKSWK